jgi:hypothetical protein
MNKILLALRVEKGEAGSVKQSSKREMRASGNTNPWKT